MDKPKGGTAMLILCLFIIFLSIAGNDEHHHSMQEEEEVQEKKTTLLPVSTNLWTKVKTLINQVQSYFFPPNLDFRSRDEIEGSEDGGAGEKVKEAVAKSLGKSKAAVEDSAKSAAEMVKETLSPESQAEL